MRKRFLRGLPEQDRPLLQTKNPRKTFTQILQARRPLYAKIADIRVDTSVLTDEEVAVAILTKLGRVNRQTEITHPGHGVMMQISATELKERLVSFAREIGFDSCRVAACGSAPHAKDFRNWLRDGGHGEMNYMERGEEKRCDPEKILPDARSIVALALELFSRRTNASALGARLPRRPNRALCVGRRLSRSDRGKAEQDRRVSSRLRRTTEMLCRYRAGSGTRSCGAGWHRLARQKHHANRRTTRDLVFSRGNFDDD